MASGFNDRLTMSLLQLALAAGRLKNSRQAKLENRELIFKAQKTYAKKLQETMMPFTKHALSYLQQVQEEEELPGFYHYADQYFNRVLTAIAQQLGIEWRIRWHVGRETLGTEFTRGGGNITVLQKLMDHAKISTTMKYVHIDADMKRAAIAQFDALEDAA
jgi:site-specific recombinase XerD